MNCEEPYRATKLWNEVIMAFQSGMPLRKHHRKMIMYRDCFMASDAVTWLHCYLMNNPNFGQDVTRQQAINLLQKFLKCRVIECITSKSQKCEFSDNSHLFRLTQITPQQFKTLPLRLVQSPLLSRNYNTNFKKKEIKKTSKTDKTSISEFQKENIPECLIVEKKMSLAELSLTWKTATLSRLKQLLMNVDINEIIDENSVNGQVIQHNVCRISKTGVVSLIDKTDDIPHWVISAMKCLANWPNASGSGSCLPNYPGFEKDVFKVVCDFFINSQVPLLPDFLSSAMLFSFNHMLQNQFKNIFNPKSSFFPNYYLNNSPVVSSADVMTSTPILIDEKERLSPKNVSLNGDGKLLLDDPEVMWDYPSMAYYETDFATSDPVTKMVPNLSTLEASGCLTGSIESVSTISMCSINYEADNVAPHQVTSPNSLKNWRSDSCLQEERKIGFASQSLNLERNMSVDYCNIQSQSMFNFLNMPDSGCEDNMNDSVCSTKTVTEEDDKTLCNSEDIATPSNQNPHSAILSNKSSPSNYYSHTSDSSEIQSVLKLFEEVTFPVELKSAFQLFLLFLNPPNRRQLHLLLRVINKILKNKKFVLDVKMSMRDYLLQTFLPAIIQSNDNQNIILGMVSFMLDNCEILFQPPVGLKEEVESLSKIRQGRIIYSMDDACNLTYCEMVSKQQYEEQKISVSNGALKSLLNSILVDKKLSDKERKKRIKQFKENHPEVYYEFFPGKQEHLVKSKSAFLNRFASLRM